MQTDSLPAEPPGKPKNGGVGSLSLLHQIFPTQELNQGLLHGRWILYQLSYQRLKVKVKLLSRVRLFGTPWTVAHQASPSMGFSRQEYWSGWPIPSPADLPDPRIKLGAPALQADSLPTELLGKPNVLFSAQLNTFKDFPEVPRGPS